MFDWMVWTTPVAVFFCCIALLLAGMTVWELKSPTTLRRGWLPIATTRGDRLFIGLLMAAAAVAVTADVNALDGMRFRNVPAYMPILLPVAVLALPLADLALAVLRRTAKGTSPFSADRGHLHHKLVDGGYTQAQAVGLLWLWAFLVAWGAVSLNFVDHMVVLPVLAVALAGAGYLTLHPIVERRRAVRNDAAAHPDERGDA